VFENRVLRRIFGPKRDEESGEWRKLHNEELHILYSPKYYWADQIKKNEVGGTCGTHGRGEEERDHLKDRGFGGRMESV
jgi:hypothetical protein